MQGFLPIPALEAPSDGMAFVFSAPKGRPGWAALTGGNLTGFVAGQVAFGSSTGGLAGSTGLAWNGSTFTAAGGITANGGAINATGDLVTSSTTVSSSTITGSIKAGGGAGINGAVNCADSLTVYGNGNVRAIGFNMFAAQAWDMSIDGTVDASVLRFRYGGSNRATWSTSLTTGTLALLQTTASTSTSTGAVVIGNGSSGGLGVGGDVYIGGALNAAGVATFSNITDASAIGTAGTVIAGGASIAKTLMVTGGTGGPTQLTKSGNYGFLAFNAASFTTGTCIAGGSSTDKDMYFLVPSTNQFHFRANNVELFVVNAAGMSTSLAMLSSGATGGIGYATGAGGTVVQATSKSTGVTLSTVCGTITLNAASLAANTSVAFTWTNTAVAATDYIDIQHDSVGTLGAYSICATPAAGSATVTVRNNTAGALAEAIVLRFFVTKAVTS